MKCGGQIELGETFQRFVDWARAHGWRYAMAPVYLSHFERFLERRGVQRLAQVDAALLIEYQRSLSIQRSPATVHRYLSTLRALWRYLLREELVTENPARGLRLPRPDYFIPHLYTTHELISIERAFRNAIWQFRTPGRRFSRRTQHAAFELLRACGLRVSEACHLNVDDYDHQARTLRIERTKFFKTRIIPLPRTISTLLNQYLEHRAFVVSKTGDPAFFEHRRA